MEGRKWASRHSPKYTATTEFGSVVACKIAAAVVKVLRVNSNEKVAGTITTGVVAFAAFAATWPTLTGDKSVAT